MASTNAYTSGTPPFFPGGAISASALERLREADQRALPQRSVGAFVSQRPGGTTITPISRRRAASPSVHPFRVFDVSDDKGLQVAVLYGAVLDLSDWQAPAIRVPLIGNQKLTVSLSEETPKLNVPEGEWVLCVVIEQGENGEIAPMDSAVRIEAFPRIPQSPDGTAYIPIAELRAEKKSLTIRQVLASQIIWPFKPDFMNWRQRKQNTPSTFWLGGGSPYTESSDILSDLFIEIRRPDFDNGRDGNLPFALRMQKGKNFELTFDRDNMRGFECSMSEIETRIVLDRKSTVASGIQFRSSNTEASVDVIGPSEGASINTTTSRDKCNTVWEAPAASIRIEASSQQPKMTFQGQGTTTVGTIAGKDIAIREVTFMASPTSSQKAYFLCSPLEDAGEAKAKKSPPKKPKSKSSPYAFQQHRFSHHTVSLHHVAYHAKVHHVGSQSTTGKDVGTSELPSLPNSPPTE